MKREEIRLCREYLDLIKSQTKAARLIWSAHLRFRVLNENSEIERIEWNRCKTCFYLLSPTVGSGIKKDRGSHSKCFFCRGVILKEMGGSVLCCSCSKFYSLCNYCVSEMN